MHHTQLKSGNRMTALSMMLMEWQLSDVKGSMKVNKQQFPIE